MFSVFVGRDLTEMLLGRIQVRGTIRAHRRVEKVDGSISPEQVGGQWKSGPEVKGYGPAALEGRRRDWARVQLGLSEQT